MGKVFLSIVVMWMGWVLGKFPSLDFALRRSRSIAAATPEMVVVFMTQLVKIIGTCGLIAGW